MVKKIIIAAFSFTCFLFAKGQDSSGEFYYNKGLEKAQSGDLEKALELFDKSIAIKGDEYVAWYNRGIVKNMLHRYEDALVDLDQTIKLNPGYKKAYLNRGTARKHLTDFGGAILDFSRATQLDSTYGEAYYNRGLVYELFDKMDMACKDFHKAKDLGYDAAKNRNNVCLDPSKRGELHPVRWLTNTSTSRLYGFSSEHPIKIGDGPDGGPANERAYLDLLRDAKGKPVQYERMSTCCGYKSDNAPKGMALLDKYQMVFTTEDGETKTVFVYFSFYDYDEPLVLFGFTTVNHAKAPIY
jgi:tetratricopeptide (TPR) repeat protein